MADEQTTLPNRPPAERYYTEHVRISPDDGADNELLRADANEKLRWGWRLVNITKDPNEDSVELVWDTSGISSREPNPALYETIRLTTRRLLGRAYERFWKLPWHLVVLCIGVAMMLAASAMLVYLAAVLLARFVAL